MSEYSSIYQNYVIKEAIDNKRIVAQYQPIISVVKKKIVGFEGLSRGINGLSTSLIPPIKLFQYIKKNGGALSFDRLCREKCLEGFRDFLFQDNDFYLFINVEASVIDQNEGSNYLLSQIIDNDISPKNIVIEINESGVKNIETLVNFVHNYRKAGFLIALDDLGTGFSNFERIFLLKPDIIKLDRSLIKEIQKCYHKQEIFKCLVSLANKIGAIVVAEGIETEEELNSAIEYGAHLIQGYYFSKPQFLFSEVIKNLDDKINKTAIQCKEHLSLKIKKNMVKKKEVNTLLSNFISNFEFEEINGFNDLLVQFVNSNSDMNIECAFIIDKQGLQISDTIFSNSENNSFRSDLIFSPSAKGTDYSLKKYYYEFIDSMANVYLSEPYISHATGNVCTTLSRIFKNSSEKEYIFCVDFIHKFE